MWIGSGTRFSLFPWFGFYYEGRKEELPNFVGDGAKPVIPVMLRKVNLDRHDLKGLKESQIYRYKAGHDNFRSYAQCGSEQRDDFVFDLHDKIEQRLDRTGRLFSDTE